MQICPSTQVVFMLLQLIPIDLDDDDDDDFQSVLGIAHAFDCLL